VTHTYCVILVAPCPRRRRAPRLDESIVQGVLNLCLPSKVPLSRQGIWKLPQTAYRLVQLFFLRNTRCASVFPKHSHTGRHRRYAAWLPVQRRVEFKIACFVHQSLALLAPTYLTADIHLVSEYGRRLLRSSTDRTLAVPQTHNKFDDRSFAVAGPHL